MSHHKQPLFLMCYNAAALRAVTAATAAHWLSFTYTHTDTCTHTHTSEWMPKDTSIAQTHTKKLSLTHTHCYKRVSSPPPPPRPLLANDRHNTFFSPRHPAKNEYPAPPPPPRLSLANDSYNTLLYHRHNYTHTHTHAQTCQSAVHVTHFLSESAWAVFFPTAGCDSSLLENSAGVESSRK